MENSSYALYIAIGVIIALGIISLIVFRWRQIGGFENAKDEVQAIQAKADFNSEYEAYNKKLMYGTDVLSCLNKAQNNNQKYVYSNYYGVDGPNVGKDDREEYFIDVEVTLNSPLYDDFKAYYKDRTGQYQRVVGLPTDPGLEDTTLVKNNYKTKLFNPSSGDSDYYFEDPDVDYYYFKEGKVYQEIDSYSNIMWNSTYANSDLYTILTKGLGGTSPLTGRIRTNIDEGTYNLLVPTEKNTISADRKASAQLSALISTISLKSQKMLNGSTPSTLSKDDWWYCEWTTAANDFKTRRFKCTGTDYNQKTGYIEKISFEEVER